MISHDDEPAARPEQSGSSIKHLPEHPHLTVDLYPESLKHTCQILLFAVFTQERAHYIREFSSGFYIRNKSVFYYSRGYTPTLTQFSVCVEYLCELLLGVVRDNLLCSQRAPLVHTHVQRSIISERKSTFRLVEVVTAHAEVSKYAIHLVHAIVLHPVAHEAEVASNEREAFVSHSPIHGIKILVEPIEMTFAAEQTDYLLAMPPSAVRQVDIRAVRTYIKSGETLMQHHGYMVAIAIHRWAVSVSSPVFASSAMSSSKPEAKASVSSSICSAFWRFQISIVSSMPIKRTSLPSPTASQ